MRAGREVTTVVFRPHSRLRTTTADTTTGTTTAGTTTARTTTAGTTTAGSTTARVAAADRTRTRGAATGNRARGGRRLARVTAYLVAHLATVALVLSIPTAAFADSTGPSVYADPPQPDPTGQLRAVIGNLQGWIMGILFAVATLFLVLAGVYWSTAGGDTAQVDKAKGAFKNALIGYGLAVLAPVLLQILKGIVGG
jgi:hypothetical protein